MTIADTVKALGARVTMSKEDIRSRLHEDHVRFREWTTKMAEGERTDERARAFAQLKPALTAHARIEEKIAYDGLIHSADNKESDTLGREGYVEHHIADHLVMRLSELDPASDEWRAHAKVLHEMLAHHIEEEETDIFAKLGDAFTREQLEQMGARFEREKASFVPPGPAESKPPKQTVPNGSRAATSASKASSKSATARKPATTRKPANAQKSAVARKTVGTKKSAARKRR